MLEYKEIMLMSLQLFTVVKLALKGQATLGKTRTSTQIKISHYFKYWGSEGCMSAPVNYQMNALFIRTICAPLIFIPGGLRFDGAAPYPTKLSLLCLSGYGLLWSQSGTATP